MLQYNYSPDSILTVSILVWLLNGILLLCGLPVNLPHYMSTPLSKLLFGISIINVVQ